MRTRWPKIVLAALAAIFTAPPAAAQVTAVSVHDLARNPASHYDDAVKVTGTIAGYQARTTPRGTPYSAFRLQAGGASVEVFAGRPKGLRDGLRVRVTGTFVKSKRIGRDTFRNAVEAIRIDVLAK